MYFLIFLTRVTVKRFCIGVSFKNSNHTSSDCARLFQLIKFITSESREVVLSVTRFNGLIKQLVLHEKDGCNFTN